MMIYFVAIWQDGSWERCGLNAGPFMSPYMVNGNEITRTFLTD